MSKPTIYLSGPMTGYHNYNFAAFNRVANFLRSYGYPVVNPADHGSSKPVVWRNCIKRALIAMMDCEIVILLPGWAYSKGAQLESQVAEGLGIAVHSLEAFLRMETQVTKNMAARVIKRARGILLHDLSDILEVITDISDPIEEAPPGIGIVDRALEEAFSEDVELAPFSGSVIDMA